MPARTRKYPSTRECAAWPMSRQLMAVDVVLSVLRETPHRLGEQTCGASDAQLERPPGPGEWSVTEILAHLRSCADVWGDAIERILDTDHPTIRAVNPTSWIERTDYRELHCRESLSAFTEQRGQLLALLERLPAGRWSRAATVVGGGAPLERTVHSYADRLARHERAHWRQVAKTVKSVTG